MRCGCPVCGEYMIQAERGLSSGCVCPACGNVCTACMGNVSEPKSAAEAAAQFLKGSTAEFDGEIAPLNDEERIDWRKLL